MKLLTLTGILLCCLLCNLSMAQSKLPLRQTLPNKSPLFSKLPQKVTANKLHIDRLFSIADEGYIKIPLADNNYFEGVVLEKVRKNPNVISMNVKLTNYEGAMLTVSKIVNDDQTVNYVGRIVSIKHGDIYMLTFEDNKYYFTKQMQSLLLVE
jgi:hypothetical protein